MSDCVTEVNSRARGASAPLTLGSPINQISLLSDPSSCLLRSRVSILLGPQGRNADEQVKMVQRVQVYNASVPPPQRITVSVEIEKAREALYQLFPRGDVVRAPPAAARRRRCLSPSLV